MPTVHHERSSFKLKLTYQPFLDGFRALAITLVILNHLNLPGFAGGFIGVDVFFVISGYLITGVIVENYLSNYNSVPEATNRYINIRVFYFKRIRRIVPVAVAVLAISLIYIFFNYSRTRFIQEANNAGWSAFFLSNFQMITNSTNYFASDLENKSAFQHFWSLAIEEQFYLLYPIVFSLAIRLHGLRSGKVRLYWYRRLGILLCLIWFASFTFNLVKIDSSPLEIYFSTFSRIWEIVTGCILALIKYTKAPALSARRVKQISYLGLFAILLSSTFFSSKSEYPGLLALIPVIGACCLIYSSTSQFSANIPHMRLFSNSAVRYIGKISYSLYLIHWPLLIFVEYENPGLLDGFLAKIIYCAILVALSALSYAIIEKPTRRIPVPSSFQAPKSFWSDILMRYLTKVGGDVWFIFITLIVIFSILFSVQGYTPKPSSTTEFQPYVYPKSSQPFGLSENSGDSGAVTNSNNGDSSNFQAVLSDWKNNFPKANSKLTIDSLTNPTLAQLNSESHKLVPWGFQSIMNSCDLSAPVDEVSSFICDYRSSGGGDAIEILLMGDSHAQQMVPTILEAFSNKRINLTVFGRSGCPIGGVIVSKSPKSDMTCLELWRTQSKLKFANKSFDYTIASDWGGLNDNVANLNAKEQSLKFLKSISNELILFAPTPRYPNLDCITEKNNATNCFGTRYPSLDFRYESLSKLSGGRFFPISDFMCLGNTCPAIIKNSFVTIGDGSHLSGSIATLLGKPFAEFLQISTP